MSHREHSWPGRQCDAEVTQPGLSFPPGDWDELGVNRVRDDLRTLRTNGRTLQQMSARKLRGRDYPVSVGDGGKRLPDQEAAKLLQGPAIIPGKCPRRRSCTVTTTRARPRKPNAWCASAWSAMWTRSNSPARARATSGEHHHRWRSPRTSDWGFHQGAYARRTHTPAVVSTSSSPSAYRVMLTHRQPGYGSRIRTRTFPNRTIGAERVPRAQVW